MLQARPQLLLEHYRGVKAVWVREAHAALAAELAQSQMWTAGQQQLMHVSELPGRMSLERSDGPVAAFNHPLVWRYEDVQRGKLSDVGGGSSMLHAACPGC